MIASQPCVSVIIPCHNAARFVHRAIGTALGQTYRNVEVVLVDDRSTDDLAGAIKVFRNRIVFCRNTESRISSGPSRTRNTGACGASGEVLAFLDADDWWPEDLLEKLVPQVSPGHAVCYDNHVIAEGEADQGISGREHETLLAEWLKRGPGDLCRGNMEALITIPSLFKIIVARRDYEEVGGFDERFFGIEDFHFFMKLLSQGTTIHVAPHPKGCYLVHPESLLRTIKRDGGRQVESLSQWRQMFSAMPEELALSEKALRECRRRSVYYRARYVDARLRHSLATRDYRSMISSAFLRDAVSAAPQITRFKLQGLARKLHR